MKIQMEQRIDEFIELFEGYEDGEWRNFGNYLTHWWNLPEVME